MNIVIFFKQSCHRLLKKVIQKSKCTEVQIHEKNVLKIFFQKLILAKNNLIKVRANGGNELEKSLTIKDFRLWSLKALTIFLIIKKKPATGSCNIKLFVFLVCFDVSLGNLQIVLFNQC